MELGCLFVLSIHYSIEDPFEEGWASVRFCLGFVALCISGFEARFRFIIAGFLVG
jgi:hypothetical protein